MAILTFDHQQKQQQQQQSKSQVQQQPPAVEDSILDKTQEEVQVHHQEPTAAATTTVTVAPPPAHRVSAVSSLSSGPGVKRSPSMNDSHYLERASVAVHQVRCQRNNLFSQQFAFFCFRIHQISDSSVKVHIAKKKTYN